MFQHLINFDVNECLPLLLTPGYLDEALRRPLLDSDTAAQMVVQSHPSL